MFPPDVPHHADNAFSSGEAMSYGTHPGTMWSAPLLKGTWNNHSTERAVVLCPPAMARDASTKTGFRAWDMWWHMQACSSSCPQMWSKKAQLLQLFVWDESVCASYCQVLFPFKIYMNAGQITKVVIWTLSDSLGLSQERSESFTKGRTVSWQFAETAWQLAAVGYPRSEHWPCIKQQ